MRQLFFGPRGTVTPLHHDPYENALCQLVGAKYVRLYAPTEENARRLCAGDKGGLRNQSRLEPADLLIGEANDAYRHKFPELKEAKFVDMVLEEGDLLFLPRGWWHYVKSLSTSISIAFHFN
eukprot:COSAG04_NODE_1687_length_5942_cov_5.827144_6_plen_122_part_00